MVFGIAARGIVRGATEPLIGEASKLAGALAFAMGFVFLVIGRAELSVRIFLIQLPLWLRREKAQRRSSACGELPSREGMPPAGSHFVRPAAPINLPMNKDSSPDLSRWKPVERPKVPKPELLVEDFVSATAEVPHEKLAERLGVHALTVAKWRRSPVRNLSDGVMERILDILEELSYEPRVSREDGVWELRE